MKKYGLPYMGSKSKIAEKIISVLPEAKNFYDLFAGGCAITHCALESGKYKSIIVNDLNDAPQLFLDAVNGKYKNERRWIDRETFHAMKGSDPFIRWVWSFGNDGCTYIFGSGIEPIKKAAHEYLMNNGYDGTKEKRLELIRAFKKQTKIDGRFELEQLQQLERLERLQQLQQLEQLERLQQLERLERLERLEVFQLDYRDIKIYPDSVVYCDIPYYHKEAQKGKKKYYGVSFDQEAFYSWARDVDFPVYFSSVFAPDDFNIVLECETLCKFSNKNSHGKQNIVERLFWNGKAVQ